MLHNSVNCGNDWAAPLRYARVSAFEALSTITTSKLSAAGVTR